MNIRTGAWGGN